MLGVDAARVLHVVGDALFVAGDAGMRGTLDEILLAWHAWALEEDELLAIR